MMPRILTGRRCAGASLVLFVLLALPCPGHAGPDPHEPRAFWIYQAPQWDRSLAGRGPAGGALGPRALSRMHRCGADTSWADPTNRPIPRPFLEHLADLGIRPRVASRFLRAVSAEISADQRKALEGDPGILRVVPVLRFHRQAPARGAAATAGRPPGFPPRMLGQADTLPAPEDLRPADYGPSYGQLHQIGAVALHRLGYAGRGVLVCLLDAGYRTSHESFRLANLVATRDFVGGDRVVSYEPGDTTEPYNTPLMEQHGTLTWSTLGGFVPGVQCGPAYAASFALGRTEIAEVEIRVEEDYYVAGLEWADSLGAEVVSTSLGYLDFQDGFAYTPEQLDGRTAVTSRGAEWLARRGVLLVTAMGNFGPAPRTLLTPADADSVVSVGAVDSMGALVAFSSRGPTADGRIKPDVCAQGHETWSAVYNGDGLFGRSDGTSLAAPLIGGLAALLREAHPEWGVDRLLQALRLSADQAQAPDDGRGWGVPDGLKAVGTAAPSLALVRTLWTGAAADSVARPGDSGRVVLLLRNQSEAPLAAWISIVGGQGIAAARDSVLLGPVAPGASAPLPRGLEVMLATDLPAPSETELLVRVDPESGGTFYLRARLALRPAPPIQVRAFPNPLPRGAPLTVELAPAARLPVRLEVFDAAGRAVGGFSRDPGGEALQALQWQPPPRLPSGVYVLRVRSGASASLYRVVILK